MITNRMVSRVLALATLGVALCPVAKAVDPVIGGVTYYETTTKDTVTVPFTTPETPSTKSFSGYVKVKVSGTGQSLGSNYNDAFYLFANGAGNPIGPGHDGTYYQLNISTNALAPFIASGSPGVLAYRQVRYDYATSNETTPPYVPAYRSDHTYEFVVNTALVSPGLLHFGVSDGQFNDNSGSYTIEVTQLSTTPPPTIVCKSPVVLWSPNHDLVDVSSAFEVYTEGGAATTYTIKVYSDEVELPDTGDGMGQFAPDFKDEHNGGRGVLVRSERSGNGNGRFFIGEITATNSTGSTTHRCVLAVVPRDKSQASLDLVLAEADLGNAPYLMGVLGPVGSKQ